MKVAIWDTHVTRTNGTTMHFDIIVPKSLEDKQKILTFGATYLREKEIEIAVLTTKECQFCHIEEASSSVITTINQKGYDIIELENCV